MTTSLTTPTAAGRAGSARAGIALALILSCQLMVVLDVTVVTIALPDIQRGLHFSPTGLSWTQNAYTLAFGGLLLLGGRSGDILGRRRTLLSGIVLFTFASLLGGLATSGGWLLACRAAQGVGAAFAAPSVLALIVTNFEGERRARALSLFSAVSGGGGTLGLIAGGMLTQWASWRWVMFINVPIGLAIVLLVPRFVRQPERHPGRFDLAGALTSTAGMVALVYAFIRVGDESWSDDVALGSFAAAAALLGTFVAVELRAEQPITPLKLFAERNRGGAYAIMLLLVAPMFGMFFFLTLFLQDVLGFGPLRAGLAFLPMTLLLFGVARSAPRLLARFGARPMIVTGLVLVAAGLSLLSRVTAGTGYWSGLVGPMVLFGLGVGLIVMPLNTVILAGVPPKDAGAASGALQTMQQAGGSLGLAVLVTVFASATSDAGGRPVTDVLAGGIADAFTVAIALSGAALLVALAVIRTPARTETPQRVSRGSRP